MIQDKIEKFQAAAPYILPMLLSHAKLGRTDVYEEYALLTYSLHREFEVSDLKVLFENHPDAELCYITKPCEASGYVATFCGFSRPRRRCKYKVNAMTNAYGRIDTITVTVYLSIDIMLNDIRLDLESNMERCSMDCYINITDLLRIFAV